MSLFVSSCLDNQVNDHLGRGIRLPSSGKFIASGGNKIWRFFLGKSCVPRGWFCVALWLRTTVKVASLLQSMASHVKWIFSGSVWENKQSLIVRCVQGVAFWLPCLDLHASRGHLLCCCKSHEKSWILNFHFQGHPSYPLIPTHFCIVQADLFFLLIFFMLQHLKCKLNS